MGRLQALGCLNLDDLAQFDSQLQLSLAAWGYYYEDYIRLSRGVKVLQASRGSRDQDYEIRLVHSLAKRRLNEKWSFGRYLIQRSSDATMLYMLHGNLQPRRLPSLLHIITAYLASLSFSRLS